MLSSFFTNIPFIVPNRKCLLRSYCLVFQNGTGALVSPGRQILLLVLIPPPPPPPPVSPLTVSKENNPTEILSLSSVVFVAQFDSGYCDSL